MLRDATDAELDAEKALRKVERGRVLRDLRLARDLTLRQVAEAAHVDEGDLSRVERGLKVPSPAMRRKLARFYRRKVAGLFEPLTAEDASNDENGQAA